MQVSQEYLVKLMNELQETGSKNGPVVKRCFDDVVKAIEVLKGNIYPKPGIMVIPDLEYLPQSAQHQDNVIQL